MLFRSSWVMSAVACVPRGAHPSFAMGYSERDNAFYQGWDAVSADRDKFREWIQTHVLSSADHAELLASLREAGDILV